MKNTKRSPSASKKRKLLEKSLMDQLTMQHKDTAYHIDMVKDYMKFYDLKEEMQRDIEESGLRIHTVSGNGVATVKPNESVLNLVKVNNQMLKILADLNIQAPTIVIDETDGYNA